MHLKYGNKVKVINGFFEGLKGIAVNFNAFDESYEVELEKPLVAGRYQEGVMVVTIYAGHLLLIQ